MIDTYLTIWHYVFISAAVLIFFLIIFGALKYARSYWFFGVLFGLFFSMIFIFFGFGYVDGEIKHGEIRKLKKTRLMNSEQMTYSGYVVNTGKYPIKNVILRIRVTERGESANLISPGTMFKAKGFGSSGPDIKSDDKKKEEPSRIYNINKKFTIAHNLKPGKVKFFRVNVYYPNYFRNPMEDYSLILH